MNTQPSQPAATISDTQLDKLLEQQVLQAPNDFVDQIMAAVEEQDATLAAREKPNGTQNLTWWQWLALLLAGAPGMAQVFALVFSAWHISSAG